LWPRRLLKGADGVAVLQEMGGEAVAETVGGDGFGDPYSQRGGSESALDDGLMHMVPAALAGDEVAVVAAGGERPLPAPLP
jgi:hypothetical protein